MTPATSTKPKAGRTQAGALEVRRLDVGDYPGWDAFVANSPQGTLFSSSPWARLMTETTGLSHAIYAAFKGSELVGGSSVFYRQVGPLRLTVLPPLTRYTGLVLRDQSETPPMRRATLEKRVFESLSSHLTRDFHRVLLSLHPTLIDVRPAQQLGWNHQCLYTYTSDLTDLDHLWKSIDGEARRLATKAEKQGITIRESSDVTAFHAMHAETFRRQGLKAPISAQAMQTLFNELRRAGRGELFFATDSEGECHAAAAVAWDDTTAYYLMGTRSPQSRSPGAFSLMLWKILERMGERVTVFDLFGANISSIAQFKKDFATRLASYHDLRTYSLPLLGGLDRLSLAVRRARSRSLLPCLKRLEGS